MPIHCLLRRMMIAAAALPLFFAFAGVAIAGPVLGASKAYVAIGTGTIYKGNTANARQDAIGSGLDIAVATAVAELVPVDYLVGHFSAVTQVIEGRSNDFLDGYKVLAEAAAGNNYKVAVSVTVSLDALRQRFSASGIALARKAMPRTLLFVVEKSILQQFPAYWWGGDSVMTLNDSQRLLGDKLREAGFTLVDPTHSKLRSEAVLDHPPNIDLETLAQLARAYQAEVAVVGTALAGLAPNTMGDQVKSYRAVVGLKAVRVADRKIIATVEEEAITTAGDGALGTRKALDLAAVQAGEKMAAQLAAAWLVSEDVLNQVEIAIEGTRDLANFVMFRRVIKKMPGVKSIQTTEMKPDSATLVVSYQGEVAALADSIMRTAFEPFGIDIYDISEGKMRMALIPR